MSSIYSTVNRRNQNIVVSSGKAVSGSRPTRGMLCGCRGRLMMYCCTKGENKGRLFWRCPYWKSPSTCNFFIWDEFMADESEDITGNEIDEPYTNKDVMSVNLVIDTLKHSGGKPENGYSVNTSSGHRSANEQLSASIRFVKLADVTEDESSLFLEKFQELLYLAFAKRKSITLGQKQLQRLGTSCQL
ncbi:hypothetical protein P8452_71956 [Trifolium repens]|nr:hypothetical protein P8452_71956 [Trifolium repens]